jgi:hypothetical protein
MMCWSRFGEDAWQQSEASIARSLNCNFVEEAFGCTENAPASRPFSRVRSLVHSSDDRGYHGKYGEAAGWDRTQWGHSVGETP